MIRERLAAVRSTLPGNVRLVAVSKYHPVEALREAYDAGQRLFGENHVQEMVMKQPQMPADTEWHFIGHLQTNKVKYIAPFVSLIQSVDTLKLLREIDKQAAKAGRTIPCLLQVHIAREETKFGFTPDELLAMLGEGSWRGLRHVRPSGLMCMATNTDDLSEVRREFRSVHDLFRQVQTTFFAGQDTFCELSMGMSHDYPVAVEEGATIVRVGTKIFGERTYTT